MEINDKILIDTVESFDDEIEEETQDEFELIYENTNFEEEYERRMTSYYKDKCLSSQILTDDELDYIMLK